MTALSLLAWIVSVLLLQLAVGVGVFAWRRRGGLTRLAPDLAAPTVATPPGAWSGWREFRVVRREFEDRGNTQCSFYLQPLDGATLPPFSPGQYLTFQLDVAESVSGGQGARKPITRCYSLSDKPQSAAHRITIKRALAPAGLNDVPPGVSSSYFHDHVHEGDVLKVKAPSGHFFLDANSRAPVVLVGGGIGITPMMSMLRWCLAEQPGRTVHLYYGVRHSGEHAFKTDLEQLAQAHSDFHLNVVYSRPGPVDAQGQDYQHGGYVDVELLRRTLPHGPHQFYVCGPAAMMESLVPALIQWGVPREDVHYEAFGPASVRLEPTTLTQATPHPAATMEVRFDRSGRTLVWDGQDANLLDFAERHGVLIDAGCRSGSCGSCETPFLAGTVHYLHKPDHDVAPGHCLLCVGTPTSALTLKA